MERVYLSRRNLLMLLSKLDRRAQGEMTFCTVIKNDDQHPKYPQTMSSIEVVAVEDEEYYTTRSAGPMNPIDEERVAINKAIAEVRARTDAPIMVCKKAVYEAKGNVEEAVKIAMDPRREATMLITKRFPWDERGWQPD